MDKNFTQNSKNNKTALSRELLRKIPSLDALLGKNAAAELIISHGRQLVKNSLQKSAETARQQILAGSFDAEADIPETIIRSAADEIERLSQPNIRQAINATGIVLHTALGRSIWPESVVDSIGEDLHSFVTLATDIKSGKRSERDNRLEEILTLITGAEAAAVVNNNSGATLLVLAALAKGKEVIISRGQLIEIGGAFRLPDVMASAGVKMVEVGTTNRTHLRDYVNAVTEETAMFLRAHPSNFRVVGFSGEVDIQTLSAAAGEHGLIAVDDLGAGALVDLSKFGLPYEPTVQSSLEAGADIALFSGDKLIGGSQAGIIVGKAELIEKIRRHPLHRALRADKTCLMALERTLQLFLRCDGDTERLKKEHPLYRMLGADCEELKKRAENILSQILPELPANIKASVQKVSDYPGGGSMPMQKIPGFAVKIETQNNDPGKLAEMLRLDEHCVFSRVGDGALWLHLRTIFPAQDGLVAQAIVSAVKEFCK